MSAKNLVFVKFGKFAVTIVAVPFLNQLREALQRKR